MAIHIDTITGNCPVQSEGTIDGQPFYFRARGESWSLSVGGGDVVCEPAWHHEEDWPGGEYAAGWMTEAEARQCIEKAAALFRAAGCRL